MKIAFFPGCMVDMMYPEIGIAAVNVLERLGCEVEMPDINCILGDKLTAFAPKTIGILYKILTILNPLRRRI